MADKITDKQNATTDFNGNYAKRKVAFNGTQQSAFNGVQLPGFGMQAQNYDKEMLEAINRMTQAMKVQEQSAKAYETRQQDLDRAKLEKINSITSLAAKLTPEEKKKYSKDKTKFSWPYDSLPSADKMNDYSLKSLDIISSQVNHDYNGTDGKQDGNIGDFRQGDTGDCWLLAEIKLVSKTPEGAEAIKNSIRNNNNGTFTVTFKGAPDKKYSVSEEEIKKSKDKLAEGDKDVRILEIAADKWRLETQGKSIDEGGSSIEANFLLTGQKNNDIYFSYRKYVKRDTITNDRNINNSKRKIISESIEPLEALQKIPEGQLVQLTFPKTNKSILTKAVALITKPQHEDETFKTQNGDKIYTKHAYYIERKGDEIFLHDPHNTAKPAVRMTLSEFTNREFILDGANLDFIPRREEKGFFTRMLDSIHEGPVS